MLADIHFSKFLSLIFNVPSEKVAIDGEDLHGT